MSNLRPLRPSDILPDVVIQALQARYDAGDFDQLFVVTLKENSIEDTAVYASGSVNAMGFAVLALQDYAIKYINGEIQE